MQMGMVGLGRMGANMVRRLLRGGHECVVFDVSADVKVGYDGGTATFQNQVLVRGDTAEPFSDSGDSGSMIVDRKTQQATALLFGGSTSYTIGNHMSDVLAALGVTLVP